MLKLGIKGKILISDFEKFHAESYPDAGKVWTIGWGTTTLNGARVGPNMIINKAMGDALFEGSVQEFLDFIEKCVRVPLTQNQIDALCSFTYNCGKSAFAKSSLLIAINSKLIINEDLFTRWNKARINGVLTVLDGLTRRRKAEFSLYMSKEE